MMSDFIVIQLFKALNSL